MDTTFVVLITIFLAVFFYLFTKVKKTYAYFEDRGIPYVPATFPFGSNIKGALFLHHFTETYDSIYQELKVHKVGGFFQYLKPVYLVTDPEIVHDIFVSDFSYFYDRGAQIDEKVNPMDGNLFFLAGQKWRYLRQKLSPIFTTGKLRWMYDEMYKCGDSFVSHFARHVGKEINVKEDLTCFTTDVIGSTAFGLDMDSIKNPDSKFRAMGKKIFDLSFKEAVQFAGRLYFPDLLRRFKVKTISVDLHHFFVSMITQSFVHRIKTGTKRNDIVQLLLELKQKGSVSLDTQDKEDVIEGEDSQDLTVKLEFTDEVLAAQSFVFFVAGFETTSTTLNYVLFLLSRHPEYQNKARDEIKQVKEKYNGKIEFDCLKELEFLEKCILETLRLFSPVPYLMRGCTKDYTFPTGVRIEKGACVIIPHHSIHHDSDYFPDPEAFKPERFNQLPKPGTFLPFGDGPRICIGKRFAVTEMKMVLARILDVYLLEKSYLTKEPITYKTTAIVSVPKNDLYIKVKRI